jgi:hypothetical protein
MGVRTDLPNSITAFPNPTSSTLTLEGLPANHSPIYLYNTEGRLVLTSSQSILNLNSLPTGLYQWRCGVHSGRVVKE